MEEVTTFAKYLVFVQEVFKDILEQNRKLGNTCMEIKKFIKRASQYAFIPEEEVPCYLRFFEDEIISYKGLVGTREDYNKDVKCLCTNTTEIFVLAKVMEMYVEEQKKFIYEILFDIYCNIFGKR